MNLVTTARAALAALCLAFSAEASAAISGVFAGSTMDGGAAPCVAEPDGVRLCVGDIHGIGGADFRLRSFDGVPLAFYFTLPPEPPSGDGDYPFVVQSHGWGLPPSGPDDLQYGGPSARQWALDGYAVLQFASRGFGNSCGTSESRLVDVAACVDGYIHSDDFRFEIRDVQNAIGLLVDDGVVDADRIGVTGESYGAGVSLAMATLKNRIMNADGSLSPWTSALGTPLEVAAVAPFAGWSDLGYSLQPNGRTLNTRITSTTENFEPIGVQKMSIVNGLYLAGASTGYYAPPGYDPSIDLTTWNALGNSGEPYGPEYDHVVEQFKRYRSPYYLLAGDYGLESVEPAPVHMANGFTDDVFPADEVLRYFNLARSLYPNFEMSMLFFDVGHQRANNKPGDGNIQAPRIKEFFDHYVKGSGPAPTLGVTVYTQTCPSTEPSRGPYFAPTWEALQTAEVQFSSGPAQTILSAGGDPSVGQAFDPVFGGLACTTVPAAEETGVASYALPTPTGDGYTMLGSPVVTADLSVTGEYAYIAARLVDVDPVADTKTLIARGLYRIDPAAPNGRQTFQLHANAWHFAPGHIPRLELLGRDAPYARPSNGTFTIEVSNLELQLPVHALPEPSATWLLGAGAASLALLRRRRVESPIPRHRIGARRMPDIGRRR